MHKAYLLLASAWLLGLPVLAEPILTLSAESASIFTSVGATEGEFDSVSASDASFTLNGSVFTPGSGQLRFPTGVPLNFGGVIASCCFGSNIGIPPVVGGTVTLDGSPVTVNYVGSTQASLPSNTILVLPAAGGTVIVPGATATGSFAAFSCGPQERPPNCSGPQIAQMTINLPGFATFDFTGPNPMFFNEVQLIGTTFTSVPEPSSIALLLSALVVAWIAAPKVRHSVRWFTGRPTPKRVRHDPRSCSRTSTAQLENRAEFCSQ